MEFNPGGLLLIALIILAAIIFAAILLAELLVLLKVIKESDWPLRISLAIALCFLTYYLLIN
jgi:hypothetical protein